MSLSIQSKQLLWKVTAWLSRNEPHGHEFSIWVSPSFLETARRIKYDEGKLQECARSLATMSGVIVSRGCRYLSFGQWGLQGIDLLDGGRCFHLQMSSEGLFTTAGGKWSSHNIDHASDQSLLMAIWLSWAQFVEAEMQV
ncbi:MAG TPA: hypothetical protein VIJ29_04740 [Candidatus Paceibacterota bacterium]